ncbi:MAG: molybdenum cofactor guanylyltransferase [Haloarculaceae archaeon]
MTPLDLTPVVLAGGGSTRFADGDKALAEIGGQPMLARVVARTRAMTHERTMVAVNTSERAQRYRTALADWTAAVGFVTDLDDFAGPMAGLAAAVERAGTEWLFVCGCDQPFVSSALVERLADHVTDDVEIVVPATDGETHPLGALYRRTAVERALADLPRSVGLHRLFDELHTATVEITGAERRALENVNTVAALQRARDTLG